MMTVGMVWRAKQTMTCDGKHLVPEQRYDILAKNLQIYVSGRVAPCSGKSFLPHYFISFRSEKFSSFEVI